MRTACRQNLSMSEHAPAASSRSRHLMRSKYSGFLACELACDGPSGILAMMRFANTHGQMSYLQVAFSIATCLA